MYFQVVSVTFDEVDLERGFDFLSLYDGSSENSALLGRFDTTAPTSAIRSTGSSLFVVFRSDHSVNTGRFALNWEFFSQDGKGWLAEKV